MHVSVMGNPDDSVLVTVRGNLDIDSSTVLTTALDQVLDQHAPRIVVDLSGIEFCDSIGLSAFVTGWSRATAKGGWLRLAAPGEFLTQLLDTVGITDRVGVYTTVGDAIAGR